MYGIPRGKHAQQPKRGGPVKGPGTGTSDSIKAEVPAGSYIMPADSTAALGFGSQSVGQQAQPGVPVNLSNGEYQLAPEQVHAVGVQALEQAKAATHTPVAQPQAQGRELFFANGGVVEDPLKKKQTSFDATNTQVSPGYSDFRPAAALQQASDARHQQTAVRADAAQSTVSRATNGAIDTAMQVGAVQNSLPPKVPAAPPSAVARRPEGFAPSLKIMQPARDAQMVRRIRAEEQATPANPAPAISQAPAVIAAPAERGVIDEFADGLGGAAKTAVGVLAYPQLAAYDGLRNAAGTLAGGDTRQIKQYRDDASGFAAEGMTQMQDSSRALREGAASVTREALGINKVAQPLPEQAAPAGNQPIAAGSKSATANVAPAALDEAAQVQGSPDQAAQAGNSYMQTGIGQGAAGGPIVGRVGADGVPEFTNDAQAVAGSRPMQAGGFASANRRQPAPTSAMNAPYGARVLASGTNVPGGDAELAGAGSAANLGNGIGAFSVMGQEGDAAKAIATYDRANAIRAGAPRPSELGDNGGQLNIVRDSSRAPTVAELMNDRLEGRQEQRALEGRKNSLREREVSTAESESQLLQQKTQQDMQVGQLTLEQQQRVAQIQQQLADPNLTTAQRAQLESAYTALTTTSADRAAIARDDATRQYQQQRVMADLFKAYSEAQPVGNDGKTPVPFEQWAQPALQSGQQAAVSIGTDQRAIAIRDNPQLSREQKAAQLKALGYN